MEQLVEERIEQQIIDALRANGETDVYYSGAWGQADVGTVKGDEDLAGIVVAVTVSPRTMDGYNGGESEPVEVDFLVDVSVAVSAELDPTGARILAIGRRISRTLWAWVREVNAETESVLTVRDGDAVVFAPGGVQQMGGQPPTLSDRARVWSMSNSLNIRGIIYGDH